MEYSEKIDTDLGNTLDCISQINGSLPEHQIAYVRASVRFLYGLTEDERNFIKQSPDIFKGWGIFWDMVRQQANNTDLVEAIEDFDKNALGPLCRTASELKEKYGDADDDLMQLVAPPVIQATRNNLLRFLDSFRMKNPDPEKENLVLRQYSNSMGHPMEEEEGSEN